MLTSYSDFVITWRYRVFLGTNQYFFASDIGHGKMQWYAFHGEPPSNDPFPEGMFTLCCVHQLLW